MYYHRNCRLKLKFQNHASTTEHVNNYPDIIENQKDFSQIQMSRDQFDELPFYIKEKIMREHPKFKDEDHEENNDSSDLNSQMIIIIIYK